MLFLEIQGTTMYKYILFISILFVSCSNKSGDDFTKEDVTGNWLILYPQHILKTDEQRKIYGKLQDSIISLFGLKLVSIKSNGEFLQVDSLFGKYGKWTMTDSGRLKITAAGKGFDDFNGKLVGVLNDTILIDEITTMENEPIKLIWHFKKIGAGEEAARLFRKDDNQLRQRPGQSETGEEIKKRVIAMLTYYSLYYKVVSEESIYFSRSRVFLPFNYYQSGVGLKAFDPQDPFTNCFFDVADARKGYDVIKAVVENTKDEEYPSGKNFVIEYSEYFGKLARALK